MEGVFIAVIACGRGCHMDVVVGVRVLGGILRV